MAADSVSAGGMQNVNCNVVSLTDNDDEEEKNTAAKHLLASASVSCTMMIDSVDDDQSLNNSYADDNVHVHAEKCKRKRPRTKAYRTHLKNEIERALCSRISPLNRVAFTIDSSGRLSASLDDVIVALELDDAKYRSLSRAALAKLGDISTMFSTQMNNKADGDIRICVDTMMNTNFDLATVYVDNLPRQCDIVTLYRRAIAFGTVASLNPIFSSPKAKSVMGDSKTTCFINDQSIPSTSTSCSTLLPVYEQYIQAAFIQFVNKQSASNFREAYAKNWPQKIVCKRRKVRKAKRGLIRGRRYSLRVQTLVAGSSVNMLTKESRKRKRVASEVLSDEETPLKKSRSSFNIADEMMKEEKKKKQDDDELRSKTPPVSSNPIDSATNPSPDPTQTSTNLIVKRNKKRRRPRLKRRQSSQMKPKCRIVNLLRYFRHMQVLSLEEFKELRAKYLKMKRDSFKQLKLQLRNQRVPVNKGKKQRKGGQRNKRGRAKLMARIVAHREQQQQQQPESSVHSVENELVDSNEMVK